MANFEPKKLTKENINKGQRYQNGDGVDAEAINAPIESALWVQNLAVDQPNVIVDSSATTISVTIQNPDNQPYFQFTFPEFITERKLRDRSIELIDTKEVFAETFSFNAGTTVTYLYADPNDSDDYELYLPPENGTLATREWTDEKYAPKGYRLIRDITLEEDIQQIDINTDDSGTPLKLKAVFITFFGKFTGNTGERTLKLAYNGGLVYQMYRATNLNEYALKNNTLQWIKSERMNLPDRSIWVSQFSLIGITNGGATYNNIQGLADMNSNMQCDYAENSAAKVKTINRIQYGQTSNAKGLMAAGSRIFIWGIDDDE